jgi:HEAT repeat protein
MELDRFDRRLLMTRSGWLASLILLAGAGCGLQDPSKSRSSGEDQTPAPARSQQVSEALEALKGPPLEHPVGFINFSNFSPSHRIEGITPAEGTARQHDVPVPPNVDFPLLDNFFKDCPDTIELLIQTPERVDQELLKLVAADPRIHVRYRAARILVARHCEAVGPLLADMAASNDAVTRYVGLNLYYPAIGDRCLPPPTDVSRILALYSSEPYSEIKEKMTLVLGQAKARGAVKMLLERVRREDCPEAVWALGTIGDPRAVSVLIQRFPKGDDSSSSESEYLEALAKLNTPEAVDFLVRHLDSSSGPECLARTSSVRALPALKAHLEKLKKKRNDDKISAAEAMDAKIDIAKTRIAIVRLSYKDPVGALMALIENTREDDDVRRHSMETLMEYDTSGLHPRLLKLFTSEKDTSIRCRCIELLSESSLEGVTNALTTALLAPREIHLKDDVSFQSDLLEALNKRLKTSFKDADDMRNFLRTRHAQQP